MPCQPFFVLFGYAFPELPNSCILLLATCLMASFAGPKILRGSNSLGEFARVSRTLAVNAKRRSVSTLTFAMPSDMAFLISASGMPFALPSVAPYLVAFSISHWGTLEAPCSTSGMGIFWLMVLSRSMSSLDSLLNL